MGDYPELEDSCESEGIKASTRPQSHVDHIFQNGNTWFDTRITKKKSGIRKFTLQSSVAESKMGLGGLLFVELIVHLSNSVYLYTWSGMNRTFVS